MNFDEFYPLLKTIFTKEDCDIIPCADNFSVYLAARYISFYHPSLCELLNESVNKFKINAMFNDPEEGYKFLKGLIPKLPYPRIKYIKKESVKKQRDKEISDEIISRIANYMEISQREVRNILARY
jgi:hypothetical protein